MATSRRGSAEVEVRFIDRFTREVRQAARGVEDELKRSRGRNRRAAEEAAKDQPYQDANGRWRDGKGRYLGGGGGKGKAGGWDPRHGARDMMDFGERVADAARAPIDTYIDFEKQMDSVAAATFDMTKSLDVEHTRQMNAAVAELSNTARRLGADTKFSASEAAAGMDILAKNFAGEDLQKAQDVMAAMPGILDTAAATNQTIAEAADVSSAAMNQFGLEAKDMGRIGDILVKTANSSATGLIDLGEALKYSGVTANKAGVDLATTAAMLGALGNAGKTGSVAGTGLASVLGNIQGGAKKQKGALAALGIDITDKEGNLKPVVDLLADMQKAADKKFGEGKGGVRRDRWLQGLVGMGGDKEALAILMQQAGSGKLQELVKMNLEAEGTAKAVAAAMSNNAAGAADELSGAYEELQLTLGEAVIPEVVNSLKWAKAAAVGFAGWAKENPELVKSLGMVAAAIAAVGVASGLAAAIMMVNPIVAIATGIALAAVLIYRHWEPISAFFAEHWGKVALLFAPVAALFAPVIGAAALIMENWKPIGEFFTGLWEGVTATFEGVMNYYLKTIGYVADVFKEFKIGIMSPEEFAAYEKTQARDAEASARAASNETYGGLFDDDIDRAASTTRRGGLGDNIGETGHNRAAMEALNQFSDSVQKAANIGVYEQYGPSIGSASDVENRRLAAAEWEIDNTPRGAAVPITAAGGRGTKNELRVVFDPETGKVTRTSLKGDDNPDFVVRANAGGQ